MTSFSDILYLARNFQVICIQESLLLPSTNFNVPGFSSMRSDIISPGTRGICLLIRRDFRFSTVDLSHLSHPSVEFQAVLLHCSLDSPVLILNLYRHPNSKTSSTFYNNLFSALSAYKYLLILGDFNAHHHAWGDPRVDQQGDVILRTCENYNFIILNDGLRTFISSTGQVSSTIDLSIASRDMGILASVSTFQDPLGSDHFPVSITITGTSPSMYRFSNRLNLSDKQLVSLHSRLVLETPRIQSLLASTSTPLNPLQKYENFFSSLSNSVSLFLPHGTFPPRKRFISSHKSPSPWWNSTCDEAVESRRTLLRLYKANPSLDNWLAFKRGNIQCRKILRREKREGWKHLCSEFSFKTPTVAIWKFIRAYKNKSLSSNSFSLDDKSKTAAQNQLLSKLCPPSCLHLTLPPLDNLKSEDSLDNPLAWIDNPFSMRELELAIHSTKKKSSPGLDRIDYNIIRSIPTDLQSTLLGIYNDLYAQGLFPESWRSSLLVFIPKSDGRSVRPIALLSCLLKVMERMIYRRFQWVVETRFLLPDFQSGFRSSRSCADNLVVLTNRIYSSFLNNAYTVAVFLDVAGAFDNVVPSILIRELRDEGFPACFCKFLDNLLSERLIFAVQNADLTGPFVTHKGTPQGSILSPLLFNFFLRGIGRCLDGNTQILQYADDIVLFSSNLSISQARDSLSLSLNSVHDYLCSRGLELAPHKSQSIVFTRRVKHSEIFEPLSINQIQIPVVDSIKFLGITLDRTLGGAPHLRSLLVRGSRVSNIITSLSGVWWGAHPSMLLSLYRAIYRSSIEYGAQVLKLHRNKSLFLKVQRQQYRIIRTALGLRQSTPINILLAESCEPPLELRFAMLASRYIYKTFARSSSLIARSYRRLEIESIYSSRSKRIQLLRNIPSYRPFVLQKNVLQSIHRSITPPLFTYNFSSVFPIPEYSSFDVLDSSSSGKNKKQPILVTEVRRKFKKFADSLVNGGISVFTDGSRRVEGDDDSSVGMAIYSPDLHLALKHKLPPEASIFSAEAWAIYQALILVESTQHLTAAIFSDSKSVLDALASPSIKACFNYLIPLIRDKFHSMTDRGYSVRLAWIPSHIGILGNEIVDSLAKQAASSGRKPKFKIPYTDFYSDSNRSMKVKNLAFLNNEFLTKGIHFRSLFFRTPPSKPWFSSLSLPREQIVTVNRLRSNHYNLNYSLYRKNIVASSACECGDSRQDINHIVFRCPLTRAKSVNLRSFLFNHDPPIFQDLFPSIYNPSPKLCRLVSAFLKSCDIQI